MTIVGLRPVEFQNGSVDTITAKQLTDFGFSAAGIQDGDQVFITVESKNIRYRLDETNPTATVGHLLVAGGSLTITGMQQIGGLRVLGNGGNSTLNITLFEG